MHCYCKEQGLSYITAFMAESTRHQVEGSIQTTQAVGCNVMEYASLAIGATVTATLQQQRVKRRAESLGPNTSTSGGSMQRNNAEHT